jgi:hypothetical protein
MIARQLGLRRSGKRYIGACPACGYSNSLTVHEKNGRPLVYCHACEDVDAVFSSLRQRGITTTSKDIEPPEKRLCEIDRKGILARELWLQSRAAAGTVVETYLRSRGILLPPPAALRFLPFASHSPSGLVLPVMIAAICVWPANRACAVHRTFLDADGQGKANVEPARMSLGRHRGGAVRLAQSASHLLVGEGIETCLAAMQASGRPAWAGLSTSGMCRMDLPPTMKEITVLADGDEPGEVAAKAAAERWVREGRRVRIARPPRGFDFNDLLVKPIPRAEDET